MIETLPLNIEPQWLKVGGGGFVVLFGLSVYYSDFVLWPRRWRVQVLGAARSGFGEFPNLVVSNLAAFTIFTQYFAHFCALFLWTFFCGLAFALFALICALLCLFASFCVWPCLERPRLGITEDFPSFGFPVVFDVARSCHLCKSCVGSQFHSTSPVQEDDKEVQTETRRDISPCCSVEIHLKLAINLKASGHKFSMLSQENMHLQPSPPTALFKPVQRWFQHAPANWSKLPSSLTSVQAMPIGQTSVLQRYWNHSRFNLWDRQNSRISLASRPPRRQYFSWEDETNKQMR